MIYFSSDTHFGHQREFLYCPRGFSNVYEMNEAIIENWNKVVSMEDEVYLLGDCMLNDNVDGARCIKSLKGNIHLILGNHDTDARIEIYKDCWNIKDIAYADRLKYGGYHFFLSHYPTLTSNYDDDQILKKCTINLCGHTHTKDRFLDWKDHPIYHCELDAHNCAPVSIEQIISDIENLKK